MLYLLGFLQVAMLGNSSALKAMPGYKIYRIDTSVFEANPDLAKPYQQLQSVFDLGELSPEQHEQRMTILQTLLRKHPLWWDGYWLLSGEAFVLASFYSETMWQQKAKSLLQLAIDTSESCVQQNAEQILCKFFLASSLAKKASYDGILSSLRHGRKIFQLWSDVKQSNFDFWFRPNASLQGSVRYGLGLFYRLVPNQWLIDTMFQIRGDKRQAVQMHREALALNPEDPCARLMLGVALLCLHRSDRNDLSLKQEGVQYLQSTLRAKAFDANQRQCRLDAPKIMRDPALSCGYTQAKALEESSPEDQITSGS